MAEKATNPNSSKILDTNKELDSADVASAHKMSDLQNSVVADSIGYNPTLSENEENDEAELLARARGDAVGETLYSQRFILKTLLALSKIKNTERNHDELETDLCSLWDMTLEEDVVKFLFEEDILSVFVHVIANTEDMRLIEILVGIIGNSCCHDCGFQVLTNDAASVEMLLKLLTCMDAPILIQIMRLLETSMARLKDEKSKEALLWYRYFAGVEDLAHRFSFILKMCKVSELITAVLKTLNAILARCAVIDEYLQEEQQQQQDAKQQETDLKKFDDIFLNDELIEGINIGFLFLLDSNDAHENDAVDLSSDEVLQTMEIYLNIHTILAQYEQSSACYESHIPYMLTCMSLILSRFIGPAQQQLEPNEQLVIFIENIHHILSCLRNCGNCDFNKTAIQLWRTLDTEYQILKQRKTPSPSTDNFDSEDQNTESPVIYKSSTDAMLQLLAGIAERSSVSNIKDCSEKIPYNDLELLINALEDNVAYNEAVKNLRKALLLPIIPDGSLVQS